MKHSKHDKCDNEDHEGHNKPDKECHSEQDDWKEVLRLARRGVEKLVEIDNAVAQINATVSEIAVAIDKINSGGLTPADKTNLVNATGSLKDATDALALVDKS